VATRITRTITADNAPISRGHLTHVEYETIMTTLAIGGATQALT
jgi:hypothetical protein